MTDTMTLEATLMFFRSVIECGEQWTPACDQAYEEAMTSIKSRDEAVPAAWGRVIDGKAVTVSLERTEANDDPLYAAPPAQPADITHPYRDADGWDHRPDEAARLKPADNGWVTDAMVEQIIDRVSRENSADGIDGDSWDRLLVRAALAATPLPPAQEKDHE